MCKHVAAVLYGVGARLDERPELLFRLRAVNENDLVAEHRPGVAHVEDEPAAGKVLDADDLSSMFGLDIATPESPPAIVDDAKPLRSKREPAARLRKSSHGKPAAGKTAVPKRRVRKQETSKKQMQSKPTTAAKRRSLQAAGD